jgi:hypothetical protein
LANAAALVVSEFSDIQSGACVTGAATRVAADEET